MLLQTCQMYVAVIFGCYSCGECTKYFKLCKSARVSYFVYVYFTRLYAIHLSAMRNSRSNAVTCVPGAKQPTPDIRVIFFVHTNLHDEDTDDDA